MAENVTLANLANLQNDTTTINTINGNNAIITSAFTDVLSRTGVAPNQMGAPLDMNSWPIMNLPAPGSANSPARLVDVTGSNPIAISLSLTGDVTAPASSGVLTTTLAKTPVTSGNIIVANGSVWNSVAVSGDMTINSSGVATQNNTGTSGHKMGFLDGNNTVSGNNTYSGTSTFTNVGTGVNVNPATGNGSIVINPTQGSQQANLTLQQSGVSQWQVGKQTDNSFFIFDSVGAANVATAKTGTGQGFFIRGTNTNDSAAASFVGEYISSTIVQASALPLTNNTPLTITSITLTPGDWDIWGAFYIIPAATTTVTAVAGYISLTNNTINPVSGNFFSHLCTSFTPNTNPIGYAIPTNRQSLSATTQFFLVGNSLFATSTNAGFGMISARRVR